MNKPSDKVGEIAKIEPRIVVGEPLSGATLYSVRTEVRDLVNVLISIPGGFGHIENKMVLRLLVEMLMEGTKRKSRTQFNEALEARGIELSFDADFNYLTISIRTLRSELESALSLALEALTEPALEAKSFAVVKDRLVTSLRHTKSDTRSRARTLLSQKMFPRGHKNWVMSEDEAISCVERSTRADLIRLGKSYGVGGVLAVATGDIEPNELSRLVARTFRSLKKGTFEILKEGGRSLPRKESANEISIAGKASLDVFLGQSLSLRRDDPDYYPLLLAMSVLGHGFTSRLFANVRAREGLTYHTSANAAGFGDGSEGFWYVYGSFAPELYSRGVDALRREVSEFVARGITEEELAHRKTMLAGEYQVGLSTSKALAHAVLSVLEEGLPLSILDEYPKKFQNLSLGDVNSVIEKYLDVRTLSLVVAGSIKK